MTAAPYDTTLYRVDAKTYPWKDTTFVGFYSSEQTAIKVATFIQDAFIHDLPGGIDVFCYPGCHRIIDTPAGRRLEEVGAQGQLYEVNDKLLDASAYKRLLEKDFAFHSNIQAVPHYEMAVGVNERCYWCLSKKNLGNHAFGPGESVGYYETEQTAQKAMMFFYEIFPKPLELKHMLNNIVRLSSDNWLHVNSNGTTQKILHRLDHDEYSRLLTFAEPPACSGFQIPFGKRMPENAN